MEAWVGCLAGALEIETYTRLLADAGFEDIARRDHAPLHRGRGRAGSGTLPAGWEAGDGKLASAFVRATKPGAIAPMIDLIPVAVVDGACCDSSCCS